VGGVLVAADAVETLAVATGAAPGADVPAGDALLPPPAHAASAAAASIEPKRNTRRISISFTTVRGGHGMVPIGCTPRRRGAIPNGGGKGTEVDPSPSVLVVACG
jgi:hypothetical protein